ncbi:MAG: alkylmercury lyase family protein [Streptosporangiaceae bacterium]
MRIEVLTVPDCPNGPVLEQRLAEALAGRADVQVERRVVATAEEAERRGMHGSPTVLVDGRDPFAAPETAGSISCRLYRGEDGAVQGAPSSGQLRQAVDGGRECCPDATPAEASAGRAGRGRLAPVERGLRAVHQAVLRSFAETGRVPDPGALEAVAAGWGRAARDVVSELAGEDFLTLDEHGQIAAAYPFSATPTGVEVLLGNGVRVASMCAIDALGIPAMLGRDAVIESRDPVSGAPIRVRAAGGVMAWEPASTVVFYGARPQPGPSAAVCCGYLRFFETRATAGQFAAAHPEAEGSVLSQDEARARGEEIFGPLLAEPAPRGPAGPGAE